MKKFLRYLAAALLVGTSFAAASCSDDPEEPAPTPQFPTPLPQQTILPGDSYSFQIKPNMDWVVSIPDEALTWFYLDDKGTKVSKLRGTAVVGDQPITIKVGAENVELFDAVPPVDVTMTMGNPAESQTIASFVIQLTERELKFYLAKTEEGEYVYNEDESSPLQYSYEAEPKTEGSVKLEKHGAFYNARLLVESNVSWTLSVPDWIDMRVNGEEKTAGTAGKSEVELRANTAQKEFSLEGVMSECPFQAKAGDDSSVDLAKITVSTDNLTGLLECEGLPKEALFSPRGNYLVSASSLGDAIHGSITAPDGVQIIALPKAMYGGYDEWQGQPWVKAEIDPLSGDDKIQTRNVSINVDPRGHGGLNNQERQADLFVLPATLKDKKVSDLLADDWSDVREEYKQYLVTTITQEASTGYLSAMNSKAMEAGKATLEYDQWGMFDATLAEYCSWMACEDYGFFYRLTYGDPYSSDGAALEINDNVNWGPEGGYTSYKIFGYNAGSAGENLPADNKWIQLQEKRNTETNVVESVTVQMNFDEGYTSYYGDGKKYAVIVFYDKQNRPCITLECTYDDGTGSTGAISFAYPDYAAMEGSTLEQLQAGDPDYDKYAGTYADFTPSIYRVTFKTLYPSISMITGLPEYGNWCEVIDGANWLSRPTEAAMEFTFAGLMNSDKSAKGAYIFYSGGTEINAEGKVVDPQGPAVILVVNLVLEQQ